MTPTRPSRYDFVLSPYRRAAFTICPKCDGRTRQRKLPLVINVEPRSLCVVNKTCRFCSACELVIIRKSEIEPLLFAMVPARRPAVERGAYLIVGTIDRADWRDGLRRRWPIPELLARLYPFIGELTLKQVGGWGFWHEPSAAPPGPPRESAPEGPESPPPGG